MESKNKMFTLILFGGGLLCALLSIVSLVLQIIAFSKLDGTDINFAGYHKFSSSVTAAFLLISICFLVDGFRRMNQVVKDGACICKKSVITISVAYLSFAV